MRIAIAALAVLLSASLAAAATTRKVPQDYETIQDAVNDSEDGDTILISKRADGKPWDEQVSTGKALKFVGKKITWDGHDAAGNYGYCIYLDNEAPVTGVLIQGINFRNGNNQVYVRGDQTLVQSCTFRGAYGTAVSIDGIGAIVTKCSFRDNGRAVEIHGDGPEIVKNTAVSHGNGGFYAYGTGPELLKNKVSRTINGPALYSEGIGAVVSGNTVADCETGLDVRGDSTLVEANKVSRVSGEDTGIDVHGRGNSVLGNTISQANGTAIVVYGAEGSSEDPNLVEGNTIKGVSGNGIYTEHWTAVIRGNAISRAGSTAIYNLFYAGDSDGVTEGNSITDCGSGGILVAGGGHRVEGNTIRNVSGTGIQVAGSEYETGSVIIGNRISEFFDYGVYMDVSYSGFSVEDNDISDGFGDAMGIYVYNYFGQAGEVLGNRVSGVGRGGIRVYGDSAGTGTIIDDNEVSGAGSGYDIGIEFNGSGATLSGNTVEDVADAGIVLQNSTNCTVTGNTIERCDGVALIVFGSSNSVTGNTGRFGDGEGFSNFASNTVFTGNSFLDFRLDVTNNGSFNTANIAAVNVFETGGASQQAQYYIP